MSNCFPEPSISRQYVSKLAAYALKSRVELCVSAHKLDYVYGGMNGTQARFMGGRMIAFPLDQSTESNWIAVYHRY